MNFCLAKMIAILVLFTTSAHAAKSVGTLVFVKGDVKLFHGKVKKSKKYKSILYEGKRHTYQKAKVGLKVRANDIIHNGPDAKAKIIYTNGDHFVVGPGSSVQMPGTLVGKKKPTLNMFYGKVRSIISKKGPRKNLKVRTKAAVAGVRGTDFFIRADGEDGTEVTVLRGQVAVEPKKKEEKKLKNAMPVKSQTKVVAAGFSAQVTSLPEKEDKKKGDIKIPQKISVQESSKSELLTIQKSSAVKIKPKELPKEVKKEVEVLEKAAVKTVLDDIKEEDKGLYERLKKTEAKSIEEINTAVVSKVFKTAPAVKKKLKPTESDIEDLGGDEIYEKYFKVK